MFKNTKLRVIVAASAVSAIALGAFGFADANIVPSTMVGSGSGDISGYEISNVEYAFNATNPDLIEGVEFDLDAAAEVVRVSLDGTVWEDCTVATLHVTCDFLPTTYDSATVTSFEVFATDAVDTAV